MRNFVILFFFKLWTAGLQTLLESAKMNPFHLKGTYLSNSLQKKRLRCVWLQLIIYKSLFWTTIFLYDFDYKFIKGKIIRSRFFNFSVVPKISILNSNPLKTYQSMQNESKLNLKLVPVHLDGYFGRKVENTPKFLYSHILLLIRSMLKSRYNI